MVTMEEIRVNPSLITTEFIASLKAPLEPLRAEFGDACDAYTSELELRRENLRKQSADLDTQVKKLTAERDKLSRQVTEATSRGDLDNAAELDTKLEQVEAKISATQRKMRLADGAHLKGDPGMLEWVRKSMNDLGTACGEQIRTVEELRRICQQQMDFFKHLLEKELKYAEASVRYESQRFEKIEDEFNDGPARRAAVEAARKAEWEREKREPKREVHVFS
jgi:hypothetical protein